MRSERPDEIKSAKIDVRFVSQAILGRLKAKLTKKRYEVSF